MITVTETSVDMRQRAVPSPITLPINYAFVVVRVYDSFNNVSNTLLVFWTYMARLLGIVTSL